MRRRGDSVMGSKRTRKEMICKIPPTSLCKRDELPLFGKEGLGEILRRIYLNNYGLLSSCRRGKLLVFRYDNANDPAAKNLTTYPSYKHIAQDVLAAQQPSLGQVLQEITSRLKFP